MNIQGMGQNIAATNPYGGQNQPRVNGYQQNIESVTGSHERKPEVEQTINMHNISPNEYNAMVRSGVADLAVPMVLPGGRIHLDGHQAEMGDVKTDYIGQIEQSIEFSESIGDIKNAEFLKNRLAIVKDLHGQSFMLTQSSEGVSIKA
ncbi:hypothetical protein N473_19245 [Pseudoalteromonas luteoviolacea CPMOR-1]|uniref:Uncharacterized protein n=1 Tax=Pseudoalteromonas luteoviolacea CPMOR-1 TaxID=1365248 RepID=A0A162C5M0_9GAMM|nr:hypothetical protein [Pseudoalteromonas luteoviolacea]KZN62390.1 hypothetical protein N473_19245 [Pseudoalteromonas luteoviolacea CPMOR-1]